MRSLSISLCSLLCMLISPVFAQKGDWYTFTTGNAPVCHLKIDDDELIVDNTDGPSRQVKLAGAPGKGSGEERLEVRRVFDNGRMYTIHLSDDNVYFCTTFQYFKRQDSLVMFCADGVDNGYKTMQEALAAIRKDTGSHFSITLYKKEQLDALKRKQPITKATEEEFSAGLEKFTRQMDQFWQYRGYGRYEPYYAWMNLIYGNAFADAYRDKFNPLTLDAKNLKDPISKYSANPAVKKQLQDAGLLPAEDH
ncbi:hypothetical protein [Chitinophaga sp. CF418]|uniref:hypothetical protein n=1 Tax=Chitinophaga sp. CF418 TaxID=1855287 RepID=UPI000921F599|nr:hypothetical protein [Chitinophaga sp. CF418]SHN02457.1 hypothetical protein SAMN05216311_104378 [Chitinophaga sp. CF418]